MHEMRVTQFDAFSWVPDFPPFRRHDSELEYVLVPLSSLRHATSPTEGSRPPSGQETIHRRLIAHALISDRREAGTVHTSPTFWHIHFAIHRPTLAGFVSYHRTYPVYRLIKEIYHSFASRRYFELLLGQCYQELPKHRRIISYGDNASRVYQCEPRQPVECTR